MASKSSLLFLNDSESSYKKVIEKIEGGGFNLSSDKYPDFKIEKYIEDSIKIHNKEINYTIFNYSIQSSTSTNRINHELIVFKNGKQVGFIVEKNANSATSFLRGLLGYKKKRGTVNVQILDSSFENGEIFFWIINRIYSDDPTLTFSTVDNQKNKLILNSIDGIQGRTQATLNRVSTQGSNVINMLTTLAFILESNTLTEVKLISNYNEHEDISLEIHVSGKNITIGVDESEYRGPYENKDENELRCILLLVAYLDLIPALIDSYKNDVDEETNEKKELVSNIVNETTDRINNLKKDYGLE